MLSGASWRRFGVAVGLFVFQPSPPPSVALQLPKLEDVQKEVAESSRTPAARAGAAIAFDSDTGQLIVYGGEHDGSRLGDVWILNETAQWQDMPEPSAALWPPRLRDPRFVALPDRHEIVLVGSLESLDMTAWTWKTRELRWERRESKPSTPPPRLGHGVASCSRTGETYIFGGRDSNGLLGDLWELEPGATNWKRVWSGTTRGPSPRAGVGMSCDDRRGRLVVFGGDEGDTMLGLAVPLHELWEWDLRKRSWTNRTPPSSPDPTDLAPPPGWPERRRMASVIYDPARRATVMFGGRNALSPLPGTWTWDGVRWKALTPTTLSPVVSSQEPSARENASLALDPAGRRLLLFGGHDFWNRDCDDVWQLSAAGVRWSRLETRPTERPTSSQTAEP